jgi:hypothetical protein
MAGKRMPDSGGTYSRKLQAVAAVRRQRARQRRACRDEPGAAREEHDAAYLERHADRLRDPLQAIGGRLEAGNGGEVVAADLAFPDRARTMVRQPPDMLAAEASEHRMKLTGDISETALTLALEIAESVGASNALERNLSHQIAAAHAVGMAMLAKSHAFTQLAVPWASEARQQVQSIEAARLATAAARVLEVSHRATMALERLRNGGRQVVTVQHVTVQDGGQAVVAGAVTRGVRRK